MTSSLSEKTMRSLIEENICFEIPYEQRGYRWRVLNLLELLGDLIEFSSDPTGTVYCLQPLAVSKKESAHSSYRVWDGQQRLTTIFLLMKSLGLSNPYSFIFERDLNEQRKKSMEAPIFRGIEEESIDLYYIGRAKQLFDDCMSDNRETQLINRTNASEARLFEKVCYALKDEKIKENLKKLLLGELPNKKLIFLWYVVDEQYATEIFMDINSGKISLTNTELIKALLLSENSVIRKPELTAMQFSEIEQGLMNDNFWFMIQPQEFKRIGDSIELVKGKELQDKEASDLRNKLLRFDLLFNIVAGIDFKRYQQDPLAAFRYFYDNRAKLDELWRKVRDNYRILQSIYNDMEAYHYVGFLTYQKPGLSGYTRIRTLLNSYRTKKRSDFIKSLKEQTIVYDDPDKLDFNRNKWQIRCCLLLHNILTLIDCYLQNKKNPKLRLERPFETFPFELLYRQEWNIEHIAPATDNPLKTDADQSQWIASTKFDFPELFVNPNGTDKDNQHSRFSVDVRKTIFLLYQEYENLHQEKYDSQSKDEIRKKMDEAFDKLYNEIVEAADALAGADTINKKNCIGNYVLLDEVTNKSFHNALFPTKRRIIIAATGQQSDTLDQEVRLAYIPPCTKAAFMKFYNTRPSVSLTQWTETDVKDYRKNLIDLQSNF